MKTKTNVKAGGLTRNHNETMRSRLKLRTNVKAGGQPDRNHCETARGGLKLRTNVKAGGRSHNHNETLTRRDEASHRPPGRRDESP